MIAKVLFIILWTAVSFYWGVGGLCKMSLEDEIDILNKNKTTLDTVKIDRTFNHVHFTTEYKYEYTLKVTEYQNLFCWITAVPTFLGLLLTAISFGIIGSTGKVIIDITGGKNIELINVALFYPLLGAIVGLCVLGIAYILPSVLTVSQGSVRPISLSFLSLFCAMFSEKFFDKVQSIFGRFFKK